MKVLMMVVTILTELNNLCLQGHQALLESLQMIHTFISTCVQQCRNFRDFFVDYVKAWNQGRRDFGRSSFTRLLPSGRENLIKLAFAPCA